MSKTSTTKRRPAKTPKEVLQPKVAPAAQTATSAAALEANATALAEGRQALEKAGEAAAKAQKVFDELPEDATDEQRHEAQLALDEAEKAVKAAEETVSKFAVPEGAAGSDQPVGMPPSARGAQPEPDLAGGTAKPPATNSTDTRSESKKTRGAGNGAGPATAPQRATTVNLLQLDSHPLAGAFSELMGELEKLPAHPRQTRLVVALDYLRQEAEDLINGVEPREAAAAPAGSIPVRVTGPKKGRWRAGRRFTPEAMEIHVTPEELAAIEADPTLSSERLD